MRYAQNVQGRLIEDSSSKTQYQASQMASERARRYGIGLRQILRSHCRSKHMVKRGLNDT